MPPNAARVPRLSDRALATGAILLAGLLWSFGSAAVRFAPHADAWQYMVYRGAGQIVLTYAWCRHSGRTAPLRAFLGGGLAIWFVAAMATTAALAYVLAVKTTLVANVLLITSSAPLWSSVFAAVLLGEPIGRTTALALALGASGMALMLGSGISAGNLYGNAVAVASALGFAAYSVAMRADPDKDWTPAVLGYGWLTLGSALAGTLLEGKSLALPPVEALAAFVHGFAFIGIGYLLFAAGARRVPAGELTILAQTETVFGPLWVWMLFGEIPPPTTLAGGALVLGAVMVKAASGPAAPPVPR